MKNLSLLTFICFALAGCDDTPLNSSPPSSLDTCQKTWLDPSEHIHPNTDIFELASKEGDTTTYRQYNDGETVSIRYTDVSRLRQMELLMEAGLFTQIADLINVGDVNLSGIFKDEINIQTNVPPMGIHTRKTNGGQYVLTEKGKQWFIIDKESQGFFVCIGQEKVVSKEERVRSDGAQITEIHYSLTNIPDWYTGELVTAIPKIKNEIDMAINSTVVSTTNVIKTPSSTHN